MLLSLLIASMLVQPLAAQSEIPKSFSPVTEAFDHVRREVMIPMRDGVKLHTVIVTPKGSAPAPIILTRTPYGADKPTSQMSSPHVSMTLPVADEPLLRAGYIRVYQDVRGRYDSEGDYVMTLPVRGELNKWPVDQTTDTYDTIEWLLKNVERNNGRVGITGVSYPGWLTLMGIVEPHPALKAAVPMYPMVDGWIGDDFYHNGAFRQTMLEWIYNMGAHKSSEYATPFGYRDMYEAFLSAGSADAVARRYNADKLPTWRKLVDNPTYNAFWRGQAVQDILAAKPLKVPVLVVHGLFDQEDNFGAIAVYRALEAKDRANDLVHLAVGPWNHGQSQNEGSSLGAMRHTRVAHVHELAGERRGHVDAAASAAERRARVCGTGRERRPVRGVRFRSGQTGSVSRPSGAGDVQRRLDVEAVAGRRSAAVRRSHRRADVRQRAAHRAAHDQRRNRRDALRLDHRHR
jgi:hypothetical protein